MKLARMPFVLLALVSIPAGTECLAKNAWTGWSPGSSIVYQRVLEEGGKSTVQSYTETLKKQSELVAEVTRSEGKIKDTSFYYDPDRVPFHKNAPPVPRLLRTETLSVDGKPLLCDVTTYRDEWQPPCGNDDKVNEAFEITEWTLKSDGKTKVRSIVRATAHYKSPLMLPKTIITTTNLTHLQAPFLIDGKPYYCDVYTRETPEEQTKTVEWKTSAIPDGYAKTETTYGGQRPRKLTISVVHVKRAG